MYPDFGGGYTISPCINTHNWEIVWQFLKILNIKLLYDTAIPFLRMYSKEMKAGSQTDISTSIFIAASLTSKIWKPKSPLMNDWINKMWRVHTLKYYPALKRSEILIYMLQHV